MRSLAFLATHPVFSHAEFVAAHTEGGRSKHTSNSLLAKHVAAGRLLRVRSGLYATVPGGVDPSEFAPDPYLIATKVRDDAIVAFHAPDHGGGWEEIWRSRFACPWRHPRHTHRPSLFAKDLDLPAPSAYRAGMQYTLRNIPSALDRALRRRAREEGRSLNEVAVQALLRAVGLSGAPMQHRDLRDVAGSWEADAAVDDALQDQRRVDPELWR